MSIHAQIKSIIDKATREVIAALAKVPPAQWQTILKGKPARAERSDGEASSSRRKPKKKREPRARKESSTERRKPAKKAAVVSPASAPKRRNPAKVKALRVRLLDIIRHAPDNDGIQVGDIARKLGKKPADIAFHVDALRRAGLLTLIGERRNARWHITDQGKIATAESIGALSEPKNSKARPPVDASANAAEEPTGAATGNSEPDAG